MAKPTPKTLLDVIKASLSFGFNVDKYIDQAIRSGVPDIESYAYGLIIHSPEFKAHFPGITKPDGTLRISPTEYLSRAESFRSTAAAFGFGLSQAQIGHLVGQDVDPEEFKLRAKAIQQVKTNPDTFSALQAEVAYANRQRVAHGLPAFHYINNLSDAVNFITGQADQAVYDVYKAAYVRSAAKGAGVALGAGEAEQVASRFTPDMSPEDIEKAYGAIAEELRQAGPEIHSFGLSQQDLETIQFGGQNRERLASLAEKALAQSKAQQEDTGIKQLVVLNPEGRPVTKAGQAIGL